MVIFKKVLRIVVAIVIGVPTLGILYLAFSAVGILLIVPTIGLSGAPFYWLINDKKKREECVEMIWSGWHLLVKPFLFWHYFIIGKNPFKEMNI